MHPVEIKYMRNVVRVMKKDERRNTETTRERHDLTFIEKRRLIWWVHLRRMEKVITVIWKTNIAKNEKRGRPKVTNR